MKEEIEEKYFKEEDESGDYYVVTESNYKELLKDKPKLKIKFEEEHIKMGEKTKIAYLKYDFYKGWRMHKVKIKFYK